MINRINSWDIIKVFKDIRTKLVKVNTAIKTVYNPHKFEKLYNLKWELQDDLYPINKWFKEDMIRWMDAWEKPIYNCELFHAKIVITYISREPSGTELIITENYKYFSDSKLHSDKRVLKWCQFLVLSSIEARNIKLAPIKSVYVYLEWYNLSEDIKSVWELVSHGDTNKNIDKGLDLLIKDSSKKDSSEPDN